MVTEQSFLLFLLFEKKNVVGVRGKRRRKEFVYTRTHSFALGLVLPWKEIVGAA